MCDSNVRTVHYEPVVMKLSDYLMATEIESSFLSDGGAATKLAPILKQVIQELNTKGLSKISQTFQLKPRCRRVRFNRRPHSHSFKGGSHQKRPIARSRPPSPRFHKTTTQPTMGLDHPASGPLHRRF